MVSNASVTTLIFHDAELLHPRTVGVIAIATLGMFVTFFILPVGLRKYYHSTGAQPKKRLSRLRNRAEYDHVPNCSPVISPSSDYDLSREYNYDTECLQKAKSREDCNSSVYSSSSGLGVLIKPSKNTFFSPALHKTNRIFARPKEKLKEVYINSVYSSSLGLDALHSPSNTSTKASQPAPPKRNGPFFVSPIPRRKTASLSSNTPDVFVVRGEEEEKKLLVLMSKRCLDKKNSTAQTQSFELLNRKNVSFTTVDAGDPQQRQRRNELCKISGKRAVYPQFFFVHNDGTTTYFGDWKLLKETHEAEGLPHSYRDAHPDILKWDEVFGNSAVVFSV